MEIVSKRSFLKPIVLKNNRFFKKLVVTLTIVNDEPLLTIVKYQEVLAPPQFFQ